MLSLQVEGGSECRKVRSQDKDVGVKDEGEGGAEKMVKGEGEGKR